MGKAKPLSEEGGGCALGSGVPLQLVWGKSQKVAGNMVFEKEKLIFCVQIFALITLICVLKELVENQEKYLVFHTYLEFKFDLLMFL